jgi:cysteine synthase B
MIRDGESSGVLHAGKTILEATSGNIGIALSMLRSACEYKVKLCVPANVSDSCANTLLAYGAKMKFADGGNRYLDDTFWQGNQIS